MSDRNWRKIDWCKYKDSFTDFISEEPPSQPETNTSNLISYLVKPAHGQLKLRTFGNSDEVVNNLQMQLQSIGLIVVTYYADYPRINKIFNHLEEAHKGYFRSSGSF